MVRKHVDVDNLTVSAASSTTEGVLLHEDVIVIINQAYGPTGEKLIGIRDVSFDGYPAITLGIRAGDRTGEVHLSPIHGDRRKAGMTDIPTGTRCELFCPVSGKPLDHAGPIDDSDADFFAIYLSPKLAKGPAVYISNIWGHYNSRVVDDNDLISAWVTRMEQH